MNCSPRKYYTQGYCHVFALALQRVYGYDLASIQDRNRAVEHIGTGKIVGPLTLHVFCVKDGNMIDVRGVRPLCEVHKDTKHCVRVQRITERAIKKWVKHSYNEYTEQDIQTAVEYILKHKTKYTA